MPSFKDKDYWDKIVDETTAKLDEIKKKNNTIPISEFISKYKPLFVKKQLENLTEEQQQKLANEYASRISVYDPVDIVTDGSDPQVIMTLPPMFAQVSSLNDLGPEVPAITDHFHNAMKASSNVLSLEPEKMMHVMGRALFKAGQLKENEAIKVYTDCMDKLNDEKPENEKIKTEGFDWEDE